MAASAAAPACAAHSAASLATAAASTARCLAASCWRAAVALVVASPNHAVAAVAAVRWAAA
eukprot:scaffold102889_cov18-Phaeocystis_antarctica.AAC.1